jgi:hypothetical protein
MRDDYGDSTGPFRSCDPSGDESMGAKAAVRMWMLTATIAMD